MSARAYLQSDYRDRTIQVLEDLREAFERKRAQMMLIAKQHNEAREFDQFENVFGQAIAFGTAVDDIARMIQREQGR